MPSAPARSPPPPAPPAKRSRGTVRRTAAPARRESASRGRAPYRPSRAPRGRRGPERGGGARRRRGPGSPRRTPAARSFRRDAEREQVLVAQILPLLQLEAGRLRVGDHFFGIDAHFHRRSGA